MGSGSRNTRFLTGIIDPTAGYVKYFRLLRAQMGRTLHPGESKRNDVKERNCRANYNQEGELRAQEAWEIALTQIRLQLGHNPNRALVEDLSFAGYEQGCFRLAAPGQYARDWCESSLASALQRQLSGLLGESVQVQFTVSVPVNGGGSHNGGESVPAGTLSAESAWQHGLDALRYAFPRAETDTWCVGIRPLALKDGILTLQAQNRQAVQWMETRARPVLTGVLGGLLGRPIEIRCTTQGEAGDSTGEGDMIRPAVRTPEARRGQAEYFIQAAHLSPYDLIVRPEQEIVLPGYLARWIPYLGTTGFMILVGLRQAYYLKNGCHPGDNDVLTARGDEIARWTGLNERTFWRHFDSPQMAPFFRIDPHKRWVNDESSGRAKRAVNRYIFTASTPLTPADSEALQGWLLANGIREDPAAALARALETPRFEILPAAPPLPNPGWEANSPQPRAVQDVVRFTCGRLKREIAVQVEDLANQLAEHLAPRSDRLFFSWYFLRHWAPLLGAAPALMIALLRDRCYQGENETRNRVWVHGGNQEIARWLGLPRPKTVDEWLPPVFERPTSPPADPQKAQDWQERRRRRGEKRQMVARFLERSDYRPEGEYYAWQFRVNLNEPLVDPHRELYELLLEIIAEYLEQRDAGVLEEALQAARGMAPGEQGRDCQDQDGNKGAFVSFSEPQAIQKTNGSRARLSGSNGKQGRECQSGAADEGAIVSSGAGGEGANVSLWRARLSQLKALLKNTVSIKALEEYFNHLQAAAAAHWQAEDSGIAFAINPKVVDSDQQWRLQGLLQHNRVSPARQEALLQDPSVSAADFITGLLYAASPAGETLRYPVNHALALLARGGSGNDSGREPDAFQQLAALPPDALARLVANHLHGLENAHPAWQAAMAGASEERLRMLAAALGVETRPH